jgi:hypothetical protein
MRRSTDPTTKLYHIRRNRPMNSQQMPEIGEKYLGPSGTVWTVDSIPPRGNRIVLTATGPDGTRAAVIDFAALLRMIPLEPLSTPVQTSDADRPTQLAPTP